MTQDEKIEIASYLLAAVVLYLTIGLGLLVALLAGLFVHQIVVFGARALGKFGVLPSVGRIILLVIIAGVVITALTIGSIRLFTELTSGPEGLDVLLRKMADTVDGFKTHLPVEIQDYLPATINEWQAASSEWLRENARNLGNVGRSVGIFLTHLLIGMIIGGLVALNDGNRQKRRPLNEVLYARLTFLGRAFRRIVFSQIRISALNTLLTSIFLVLILPILGTPLPLTKTLIAVTFIAGLLPIIGNIISNTVITLVALSVSPGAAIGALAFLIGIHKLEYFVNARIVGTQIRARAWELLVAMLVMESAFGIPGLVAAPIYYAYIKDELSAKGLV